MLNVALTGNVASGKSSVARLWQRVGVPVVSADDLAREAVVSGSEGLAQVVERFGDEVLHADGSLDREALRDVVFRDAEARADLEAIIHPIVWRLRERWLRNQEAAGARLAVSEIPLLFETGRESAFDSVVFVDAPEQLRIERMVRDRDLDREEALRMARAQMAPELKRQKSRFVIDNEGPLKELEARALEVLGALRREAGVPDLVRIDMHLHSWGSWDCLSDPEQVLEAARSRGVERVAITDHNALDVSLEMFDRFPDHVIPGEEVKTEEGIDVIGHYLRDVIPRGTSARETIRLTREQGGIPYLPHPFAGGKGGGGRFAEELAPLVDVVEAFNGRIHKPVQNQQAAELALRHGKLAGGGSDAHTLGEVGRVFVELPWHPNTPDALRAALPHGTVQGRSSSHLVHLASTWAKIRRRLGPVGPA